MALSDPGDVIGVDALPAQVRHRAPPAPLPASAGDGLEAMTLAAMREALAVSGGTVPAAARALGISRTTPYRRLGEAAHRH